MAETATMSPAEEAVVHLLRRVQTDPRLAYYIGPYTESLDLLIRAGAAITGEDANEVRTRLARTLRTEAPRCSRCPHCTAGDAP